MSPPLARSTKEEGATMQKFLVLCALYERGVGCPDVVYRFLPVVEAMDEIDAEWKFLDAIEPYISDAVIRVYTIPRIGSIKLTKLTAHDLQKLYKELMESGRTRGKSGHGNPGLSSTTVRSLHLMLHNALNRAVKERLILRNPTEDCIAPKVQKFEMQILQPEHIKTYLPTYPATHPRGWSRRGRHPC